MSLTQNCNELILSKYHQYKSLVISFARRFGLDEETVKDLYHEVLIKLLIFCKKNGGLSSDFYPLVVRTLKWIILEHIKNQKKTKETIQIVNQQFDENDYFKIQNILLTQCQHELYCEKFDSLSDECQSILKLRFQKKRWKEIADVLKIGGKNPENTAKNKGLQCRTTLFESINKSNKCDEFK